MLRSIKDILKFIQVLIPVAFTTDSKSTGVSLADFGSLTFLVDVGTFTFTSGNKIAITLQHSDVDIDGSYTACGTDDFYPGLAETPASGIAKVLDATDDDEQVFAVHYRGNKAFARIALVETGTVTAVIGVIAVAGNPEIKPPL